MFSGRQSPNYTKWELYVIRETIGRELKLSTRPMCLRNSLLEPKVQPLVQEKDKYGTPFILFHIDQQEELRIHISHRSSESIAVELCRGYGEIFGDELPQGCKYVFPPGSNFGLFSWQGCRVKVYGAMPETMYVGKVIPYIVHLNIHCAIDHSRMMCIEQKTLGANVLIIGSPNSGKASLAKVLVNYAIRVNRRPTYVDLNVSSNLIAMPGTISTITPAKKYSCQEGFSDDHQSTTFHFGHTTPYKDIELYKKIVSKMAKFVKYRISGSRRELIYSSGSVIRAHGWKAKYGMGVVRHIIDELNVTHIFVINQEKLGNNLKTMYATLPVTVTLLNKPCGILPSDSILKAANRMLSAQQYFYGKIYRRFPETLELPFDSLTIGEVSVEEVKVPCSVPGLDPIKHFEYKVTPLDLGTHLLNRVYTLPSVADTLSSTAASFVYGFIAVTNINMKGRTITVLSPQPYPLPVSTLLITDVCFIDK